MDSLDMNNLVSSLPSSSILKADQDTMEKFRAAAQSLTMLYRSSQKASKRQFDAGYARALDDVLSVVQHGVSAGTDVSLHGGAPEEGMSIGRILDWIEARQESIRLRAREDDDEEEEREQRNKSNNHASKHATGIGDTLDEKTKAMSRPIEPSPSSPTMTLRQSPQTAHSRLSRQQHIPTSATTHTSPPPQASTCSIVSQPSLSGRPHTRARLRSQHTTALNASSTNSLPGSNPPSGASSFSSVLGVKRRHAAMLLDAFSPASASVSVPGSELSGSSTPITASNDYQSPPQHSGFATFTGNTISSPNNGQRRRIRSHRQVGAFRSENAAPYDVHGSIGGGDAIMDDEEEGGRERKRVARR